MAFVPQVMATIYKQKVHEYKTYLNTEMATKRLVEITKLTHEILSTA